MGNTELLCFTSAVGGSGCTSASIAMARILSMLYEKRVLIVSFDVLSCKMSPENLFKNTAGRLLTHLYGDQESFESALSSCISDDEFGVSFLTDKYFFNPLYNIDKELIHKLFSNISSSGNYDYVIIDLPFKNVLSQDIAICCEKIVIVDSFKNAQNKPNNKLKDYLDNNIEYPDKRPEIHVFSPLEDIESFECDEVDIHGQFGAEVRALASELFD